MQSEKAERIRKIYKYRRMLIKGEIKLPYNIAARLIGPDCAYHLYSNTAISSEEKGKDSSVE